MLFLMYHIGYLGYYWYSIEQINEQWLVQVEVTPNMKHVTIPITLPYWSDTDYRPAHGTINIDGKQYRTVLEKYDKDAIHLIVAEDKAVAELNASISDWLKAMNSADSDSPLSNKANFLKSVAKDYLGLEQIVLPEDFWKQEDTSYYVSNEGIISRPNDVITPPPQV